MIDEELRTAIAAVIERVYDLANIELSVIPAESGFGDYTSNIAFTLANRLRLTPKVISARIAKELTHPDVEIATSAGAGFVNITLSQDFWRRQIGEITSNYGHNNVGNGKKTQVEFISANPTGPTTIGNARGGFIGDVLSRVLNYSGYVVTREYYFNNAGTQITRLLESVKMEAGLIPESDDRQYRGSYISRLAQEFDTELKSEDDNVLKTLITNAILTQYIKPAVQQMGITFDVWFNEADLINDGTFDQTIAKLRALNLLTEHDGAVWLQTGKLGDMRKERVIIKSSGDPTYLAPDLAYHDDIFGRRGFDIAIKVLGSDHIDQFPSVRSAVLALHPNADLRMASYQWFRLMKDGREVKVSKRLGQFVTINELIDQVGLPVTRFFTLMRSADSHIDFDLDLAREQSAKNPYYYVMYAYVRAGSIMKKANEKGLSISSQPGYLSEADIKLIKQMFALPRLVKQMAIDYGVHRLTFYAQDLAREFQEYYEGERIIDLPEEQAAQKLYIVQRFRQVLGVVWHLLGIEPLVRLDHTEKLYTEPD